MRRDTFFSSGLQVDITVEVHNVSNHAPADTRRVEADLIQRLRGSALGMFLSDPPPALAHSPAPTPAPAAAVSYPRTHAEGDFRET